jgi:hypothetical protein
VRLLHRLGQHTHLVVVEHLAMEGQGVLSPRATDDVRRLAHADRAVRGVDAELLELARRRAAPDAELQAAVGDGVHHRVLLGHLQRVVQGQHADRDAEAHTAGGAGGRGQEGGGVRQGAAILVEVVLGDPGVAEAQLVHQLDLLEHAPVELGHRAVQLRHVRRVIVHAKPHLCPPIRIRGRESASIMLSARAPRKPPAASRASPELDSLCKRAAAGFVRAGVL